MEWFKNKFTVHAPSNLEKVRHRKVYSIPDISKMSRLQQCRWIQNRMCYLNSNDRWRTLYHKLRMFWF